MNPKNWRAQLRAEFPDGRIPPGIHNAVVRDLKRSTTSRLMIARLYRVPRRLLVSRSLAIVSPTFSHIAQRNAWARAIIAAEKAANALFALGVADQRLLRSTLLYDTNPLLEAGKRDRSDI